MSSAKKRVIISACILGEYCRYDGKTKKISAVEEAYRGWEIIPFCPEAPLFGTPRERINVVDVNGEHRIITDETNVDVTKKLREEIERFCKEHPHADAIVLKSKSPSCGYGTTPILDKDKNELAKGNGIAADIFNLFYKNVQIQDENQFISE
ncbi:MULTISPECIES: DUF523 domain-containing protein [Sulfurimonas]|uniref:DUF523 domain-containing protein n=1 Tax=Sulfurimonas TaxID=202746 RepID=UPI001264E96A|nr:DUF523 domain-containing protein [Sulfurimonas indica]